MEWSASAPPQFLMTDVELCLCPSYSSDGWAAKKHSIIQRVIQTRDSFAQHGNELTIREHRNASIKRPGLFDILRGRLLKGGV